MALRTPFRLGLSVLSLWPFLPIAARAPLYGRLLVELLVETCVLSRAGEQVTWAAAEPRRHEVGRHRTGYAANDTRR